MPRYLDQRVANHEMLTPEQRAFLGNLELPPVLHSYWSTLVAGLLGKLVDGYHAGTEAPDWQGAAKELFRVESQEFLTPEERRNGEAFLAQQIGRYEPGEVLRLLIRTRKLSLIRSKAAALKREAARKAQQQLPLDKAA